MKKVLAFGTFDILHPGHEYYLTEAKKLGDELVVVIGRDSVLKRLHGKTPRNDERDRGEWVSALEYVDRVTLGVDAQSFDDYIIVIEEEKPDVIALGYDDKTDERALRKKLTKQGIDCEVVRVLSLKPEVYKSSRIRKTTL